MWPSAQVLPADLAGLGVNVVVDGQLCAADLHDVRTAITADETQLVGLAGELGHSLLLGNDPALEPLAGLHDRNHALLEIGEVVWSEGAGGIEVVVEAVLDRWADAEFRLGEGLLNRLCCHVCRRMPEDRQTFGGRDADGFDQIAVSDLSGKVSDLAINARRDDRLVAPDFLERCRGHVVSIRRCRSYPCMNLGGRYWVRTSDPSRVKRVLYH